MAAVQTVIRRRRVKYPGKPRHATPDVEEGALAVSDNLTDRFSWHARVLVSLRLPGAMKRFGMTIPQQRPDDSKIFCIGFNKTGTSSLHALFRREGFRSHHSPVWRDMNAQLLSQYDCFCDGRPDDFVELANRYPRSQFILNVRDLNAWLASRLDHVRRDKISGRRNTGSVYWDDTNRALRRWVYERNDYHCRVLDHYRNSPRKLLIVNLPRDRQATKKIYAFLGLAAPPPPSPHKNANPHGDSLTRNRERLARVLQQLDIPSAEHRNDILCPSLLSADQSNRYRPPDTSMLVSCMWPDGTVQRET